MLHSLPHVEPISHSSVPWSSQVLLSLGKVHSALLTQTQTQTQAGGHFGRVAQSSQVVASGWGSELRNWNPHPCTPPPPPAFVPASHKGALLRGASLGGARQCLESRAPGTPPPHPRPASLAGLHTPLRGSPLALSSPLLQRRWPRTPRAIWSRGRGPPTLAEQSPQEGGSEPGSSRVAEARGGAALRAAPARGFHLASPAAPATAASENF
ncbi:hypothetical protein VULLAG_LOCUS19485 [Vulpes lagopus]